MFTGPDGNPDAAICSRVESDKQVGNENAGWLHILRNDDWRRPRRQTATIRSSAPPVDMTAMAAECEAELGPHRRGLLAAELGVSAESLYRLGVGWSAEHRAFTFPMLNLLGHVCGIRLRGIDGAKWSIRGGREGLFTSRDILVAAPFFDEVSQLLICEGPTDCAALLDLGFATVGRPNCTGGVQHLIGLVLEHQPREVIIVADADIPGQNGARNLAVALTPYCWGVRTITPPPNVKDAREWVRRGATAADVAKVIGRTPALRLTMQSREAGR